MLYFMNQKKDCTGCTACAASCPKQCISIEQDEEGFWYPQASNACIHCGKCERVCPSVNRPVVSDRVQPTAFAALSKDNKIWKRSASGGAFSELCYVWGKDDSQAAFGGAVWNKLSVEERVIHGYENISPLCKSKYVASYVGDCYSQLEKAVLDGQQVVFCGTPCQISGLRNYLGKDYDNLLLIDLICHGVGSPLVFQSCMGAIGKQFSDQVIQYEFRAKRKTYEQDHITKVSLASGKQYYLKNDQYMQLFLSLNALRPSCVSGCHYKNSDRMGDITIADFKGLLDLFPELAGEEKNYSTIVANTEKGKAVCDILGQRMKMMPVLVSDIVKYNPLFDHDTNLKTNREAFFEMYLDNPKSAIHKFTKNAIVTERGLKRVVYDYLPICIRKIVQKKIRG